MTIDVPQTEPKHLEKLNGMGFLSYILCVSYALHYPVLLCALMQTVVDDNILDFRGPLTAARGSL